VSHPDRRPTPLLQAETLAEKRSLIARIVAFLRPYRKRIVLGLVCTVLASWFEVGSLGLIKPTLEVMFGRQDAIEAAAESPAPEKELSPLADLRRSLKDRFVTPFYRDVLLPFYARSTLLAIMVVGVFLVVMVGLKGVFSYAQNYLTKWVVHRMAADMRVEVYKHLNTLPLDYFTRRGTGPIMAHVTSDIDLFAVNVDILGDSLIQPFTILSILVFLFLIHPPMTVLALVVVPAVAIIIRAMGKRARKASRSRQEHVAGLSGILQETFSAVRVVRAFGMERYEEERLRREAYSVFRNSMKIVRARALAPAIMETLGAAAVLLVLLAGYFIVLQPGPNRMEPQTFILYITLVFSLYGPVKKLSRVSITINNALAGAERVIAVLDTKVTVTDAPGATDLPSFSETIEYRDVTLEYESGKSALAGVSITIRKGETIALVGPSGAGKTSFVNLLARFYDVTRGSIIIDGHDIREVRLDSLRRQIGLVPQEVVLFNDTIRNNIAYGRPDLDLEEVKHAARDANAHEFIERLPSGYETLVGERGHALSGGECQRVSIARALVKNPPILIFDEATSSLDSESEIQIRKAMVALMRNRTTFVIAHRLSTVIHADRIIVFQKGHIVGQGKHEDLLRTSPLYQRLYRLQFGDAEGEAESRTSPVSPGTQD